MEKASMDAIILCGGLGTRLRSVISDRPKVLAKMGKKTCLDIIAEDLFHAGVRRLVLATGYLGKQVEAHIAKTLLYEKREVVCSRESAPLGTGGALKRAILLVQSESFLVINGDTPFSFSLGQFFRFHRDKKAALSIAVFPRKEEDAGGILLDASRKIICFKERARKEEMSFTSGGAYIMNKEAVMQQMPRKKVFSIEYDFFPRFIEKKPSFGFHAAGAFFDIGTPERYRKARAALREKSKKRTRHIAASFDWRK